MVVPAEARPALPFIIPIITITTTAALGLRVSVGRPILRRKRPVGARCWIAAVTIVLRLSSVQNSLRLRSGSAKSFDLRRPILRWNRLFMHREQINGVGVSRGRLTAAPSRRINICRLLGWRSWFAPKRACEGVGWHGQ